MLDRYRCGRPRIVGFACPKCGSDTLICRSTQPQGSLLARYYKCSNCAHRGVLVTGASKTWWRDSFLQVKPRPHIPRFTAKERMQQLPLFAACAQQPQPWIHLPLFEWCS